MDKRQNIDQSMESIVTGSDDDLTDHQIAILKEKLLRLKDEIMLCGQRVVQDLEDLHLHMPDVSDRAALEVSQSLTLSSQEKNANKIEEINAALARIEHGTYGYCEISGAPIGWNRLNAQPTATLCIDEKEKYEKMEKLYRS